MHGKTNNTGDLLYDYDFGIRKEKIILWMCLSGDLMKEEEVLYWLFHHVDHEEIADVTDEMLGKLIANEPFLAVLFCEYILLLINH